jgi:hypothetical protein
MYKLLSLIKNLQQDPETNELLFLFGKLGQPVDHPEENDWIFIEENESEFANSKCLAISLRDNEVTVDFFTTNIDPTTLVAWAFKRRDRPAERNVHFSAGSFLINTIGSLVRFDLIRRLRSSIMLNGGKLLQPSLLKLQTPVMELTDIHERRLQQRKLSSLSYLERLNLKRLDVEIFKQALLSLASGS